MNAVKDDIPALVEKELAAANQVYPLFHNNHEADGVMKEEYKEAKASFKKIKRGRKLLFEQIMNNVPQSEIDRTLSALRKKTEHCMAELAQFAAMCEKAKGNEVHYAIIDNCYRVAQKLEEKNNEY